MYKDSKVYQESENIDFESIKIGLASPEKIKEWSMF